MLAGRLVKFLIKAFKFSSAALRFGKNLRFLSLLLLDLVSCGHHVTSSIRCDQNTSPNM